MCTLDWLTKIPPFGLWKMTGTVQSSYAISFFAGIECMNCNILIGEEMALKMLKNEVAREKYRQFLFNDEVKVCTASSVVKKKKKKANLN